MIKIYYEVEVNYGWGENQPVRILQAVPDRTIRIEVFKQFVQGRFLS